jgi:imidazolonepropionase-like amidohydrolase
MLLVKNAKLITMDEINYEIGEFLVVDGLFKKVGKAIEVPADVEVIDAGGKFVTPGLVDPHCHVGIMEEASPVEGNDVNEMTNPCYPEMRGIDGLNPDDIGFESALKGGVTTVVSGPGSANAIGGTFAALKTYGNSVDEMVFVEEATMKMALGENPKRVYGAKKQNPSTRMGTAALIRESLFKAKEYYDQMKEYEEGVKEGKDVKKPPFNMKNHSLMRVFDGMFVKIHAHRKDDIMTAIRIAREFDLKMTVDHATEAHLLTDELVAAEQPIIIGPVMGGRTKVELVNKANEAAGILEKAGVKFALMTDHPIIQLEDTTVQAALLVREGLSELGALKAITIHAAELNGIHDRVGSISVGKDADFVIWSGHPFDINGMPEQVYINGMNVYNS